MTAPDQVVARLLAVVDEVLTAILPPGSTCALLDFPFHGNVGDSAIWLGEKQWLASHDVVILYEADAFSYREAAVRALPEDCVVLITGGGNFGDVWPLAQATREKVLSAFADRRVVQLPQTLHFEKPGSLARAGDVIAAMADFTLLCRDNRSLQLAKDHFACRSLLCADMAFALGTQPVSEPEVSCLWLARGDKESALQRAKLPPSVQLEDWVGDEAKELQAERWQLLRRVVGSDVSDATAMTAFARANDALAAARLNRGVALLSKGRAIVTDRLHGHILSTLIGRPHVLIDNSYGKNRAFFETWTADSDQAQLIDPRNSSSADILRTLSEIADASTGRV
jgi:pyruvyl transferase EpsO